MNVILIGILVLIDQITKFLVKTKIALESSITVIPNFFELTYVRNDGAAFSILEGKTWFLILITLVILAFIIIYSFKNKIKHTEKIILSILTAGIIGNLIDRILYGYVIDFLSFKIINYDFPVFNIADILVCVGCFIYIIYLIKEDKNE